MTCIFSLTVLKRNQTVSLKLRYTLNCDFCVPLHLYRHGFVPPSSSSLTLFPYQSLLLCPQHTCSPLSPPPPPPSFSPLFFPRLRSLMMNIKRPAPALHAIRLTSNTVLLTFSSPTPATLFISCFKLHLSMPLLFYEYKQPC